MTRIHLVDDHAVVRESLARMLADESDLQVVGQSADGEDALRAVAAGGFDLLLLDLSLPKLHGFEVLASVREQAPSLKVLILSMHAERHYAQRVLRGGAHGYLIKSQPRAAVLEAIRAVARGETYVPPELVANPGAPVPEHPHEALSERELAILIAIGRGETPSEIAGRLDVSNTTISTHLSRIRGKLDARSVGDLVRYAVKAGLVE
jgi:two-component system, NarL family, invasion response regulator UvrY